MTKELISEGLRNAICEQIKHEFYNANLYLYICGFLRNKGLDNIAKHFEGQYKEELEHGMEFFNLLTDLNADVMIPEIDQINIEIKSMKDVATLYLEREILTTKSIYELKLLSIGDKCPVAEEKMREMIAKQQHEYAEATTFADKVEIAPEWWQWLLMG